MSSLRSIIVPALAVMLASCSRSDHSSPTAPAPPNVTVLVTNLRGAPAAAHVTAIRVDSPAESSAEADSTGIALLSLPGGRWQLSAEGYGNGHGQMMEVAGSAGTVCERPAGAHDTTVFRLRLAPESFASGIILLAGEANHIGTRVDVVGLHWATATYDASGTWWMRGLPTGHWTAQASRDGFWTKTFDLTVPEPGVTVTTGTFTMQRVPDH